MKRQGFHQQQNKSQSDIHPSSGWLKRPGVREVPENEVESPVVREYGLHRSFVNVPVHGNRLPVVQRKLTIGAVGDRSEQEADRVAASMIERINRSVPVSMAHGELPQHPVTETPSASVREGIIQGKGERTGNSQESSEVSRPNKTGLPDRLKTGIENLSGYSMDDVKVHYNSSKPAQIQALAYTQGTDIHVASGEEKYLPHEAWHVVQQMQGRVKSTMQMKGVGINNDHGLESEADVMGEKAMQISSSDNSPCEVSIQRSGGAKHLQRYHAVVQRWNGNDEKEAKAKLGPLDKKVINVPVENVKNQQAWMGTDVKMMAQKIPDEYGGGILQGISANKVIERAAQIALGKIEMNPPPVSFSTNSAKEGDPQTGELILTDSHHTKNAAILLSGAPRMDVLHSAKPDESKKSAQGVAQSRIIITQNMTKAAQYNAVEGQEAYKQAESAINKMKEEMKEEAISKQQEENKKETVEDSSENLTENEVVKAPTDTSTASIDEEQV
ncbi:MAG: DUF4157 domain-containing protein [Nostocaceae cyanobacterium]|nr:DUF4157 domain-containing protein [Nostocaceae cyanobacterium]